MNASALLGTAAAPYSRVAAVLRAVGTLPLITMGVALLALLLAVVASAGELLAYRPAAPSLPTLLLCHAIHFSRAHLLWDVLTFAVLGACSERLHRARYAAFLACGMVVVPPLACALEPWVRAYGGLSGLVIGQVALLLASSLRQAMSQRAFGPAWRWAGLLGLLLVKQLYEYRIGNTSLIAFDYQRFSTVPGAHLVSALLGTLVGLAPGKTPGEKKSCTPSISSWLVRRVTNPTEETTDEIPDHRDHRSECQEASRGGALQRGPLRRLHEVQRGHAQRRHPDRLRGPQSGQEGRASRRQER